ncbi:OmpH family outer membrane protein [bacterium]|nr:OmpH family outer membrane protein [bacterium]
MAFNRNRIALFALSFVLGATLPAVAQRLAYVDSQSVLKKIPEYAQAENQIKEMTKTWESEVAGLRNKAEELEKAYQAEKVLLTPAMQKEREAGIDKAKKDAFELQRKYFGPEGELFKKRQELIKPIQDQIYNAVQEVARKRKLDLVLDKSGAITLLYAATSLDISEEVLQKMGY